MSRVIHTPTPFLGGCGLHGGGYDTMDTTRKTLMGGAGVVVLTALAFRQHFYCILVCEVVWRTYGNNIF